ncbi:adenylyl-sulfate kinase [Shewanella sp. NFH-SH190041]|uniref:adenylyl-sulfate kinase n=1 Tax=Shewanella sp. NFH-SH190041 TaxID=2950245 RepID=UPI0021C3CC77|nr:adenylyl-sulfate kinase [Shewanella sp. NFH-SH190041]BDM65513.1 adenylyl-sulfate kinase [Shewanella sp. NFH-SH190041]
MSSPDTDIVWHSHSVDMAARAGLKQQQPTVLWFTGLSGSGKSTLAGALEQRLLQLSCHTYLLDGDNVRHGLCRDLRFSTADRAENLRRVGEVAKLMLDAGLIVLCAFISPQRRERDSIRAGLAAGQFIEVHVATDLAECERRDPKGLYRKARAGEIRDFTGISAPYEPPLQPEVVIDTASGSIDDQVMQMLNYLQACGVVKVAAGQ